MEDRFEILVDNEPYEIIEIIEEQNGEVHYEIKYNGKSVNATWNTDVAQDMMAMHNIDIADQIKNTLLKEVKGEILLERNNVTFEKMTSDPVRYSNLLMKYSAIVGVKE